MSHTVAKTAACIVILLPLCCMVNLSNYNEFNSNTKDLKQEFNSDKLGSFGPDIMPAIKTFSGLKKVQNI